jgi:hypothetical protein
MNTKRFGSLKAAGRMPALSGRAAAWFLAMILAGASCPAFGAVLTVTNLADSGPGTLRDRIAAATPGDTINFGLVGTITLNSQLTITNNLRIEGQNSLKISGNNNSRVFNITKGAVAIFNMSICDGRVAGTNGPAGSNGENVYGGGVFVGSDASLLMQFCVLSNNVAIGGQGGPEGQFGAAGNGGNAFGGAIGCLGDLTVGTCTLVGNSVSGGLGGVASPTGSPGVGGQGWGGGFYAQQTANINSLTIHGNNAVAGSGGGGPGGGAGGGIYNAATMFLGTCTIVSNAATGSSLDFGGGVHNSGALTVRSCTIIGNQADFGGGVTGCDLGNTILAFNSATSGPDGSGNIVSSGYNLIQNTNGLNLESLSMNDILGQNPSLGPLTNNGGATLTMAPLPASPAIDKGRSTDNVDQRFRPRPYDGTLPNAVGGNGADIGAVEIHPGTITVLNTNSSGAGSLRQAILDNHGLGGSNLINFSSAATGTVTLTSGELFIQAPITIHGPGPDRLAISANTNSRVLSILSSASAVQINGLTIRDGLVIGSPGNNGQDGFDERGGGIYNETTLTLSNCVIRNNTVIGGQGGGGNMLMPGNGGAGLGGGLYNAGGNLRFINSPFYANRAIGGQGGSTGSAQPPGRGGNALGGAICTFGGTNQLVRCNLTDNFATGGPGGISLGTGSTGDGGQGNGGGLYNESTLIASGSTINGSRAIGGTGGAPGSGYGGGVYNLRALSLSSCSIASNSVSGSSFDFGGGIYNVGASLEITNSTIAGNHAAFGGGLHGNAGFANTILAANTATTSGPDGQGTITSYDYNLIQNFSGVNIIGITTHIIIGQDPLLGPLAGNGGPTPTMALRAGSPAIDQGNNFSVLTDQRGAPRPFDFASVGNAGGGDGADIGAFELGRPNLSISRAAQNVVVRWPAHFGDFVLESVMALPGENNWVDVTNVPIVGPGAQFTVTNNAATGNKFYRLKSR